jgi:hypothetical protein
MPRVLSDEHKAALAAGRERRAAERRAVKDAERLNFKAWTVRDADRWLQYKRGYITRDEWLQAGREDPMPSLYGEDESE